MTTSLRPRQVQRLPLVGGLFQRLFFHHLILVTLPIVVLGLLLVQISQEAISETLRGDGEEIVTQVKGQIERYFADVGRQLRTLAIGLEQAAIDNETGLLQRQRIDRTLSVAKGSTALDVFGHLYVYTGVDTLFATTDFNRRPLPAGARPAIEGALGGVEISIQPFYHPDDPDVPGLIMAAPIRTGFGEIAGALAAEVDADYVWQVVRNIQVGDNSQSFLTDSDGRLIAHTNRALVYQGIDYSDLNSVREALVPGRREPGVVSENVRRDGEEGEEMVAAFAPVTMGDLQWALVIHRPAAEVGRIADRMSWQVMVIILVGIALALVSTLVYTRRLILPIGALVEGANRLSQGDLQSKIPVAGHDELGTLASEFNLMVEQLSRIQQRLRRGEHLDTLAKFSAVVAHEIRNPLNAMQINLHLLRERLSEADTAYLDIISGEIQRLENLVREFQTISRPPTLSLEPLDVNSLLRDIVNLQKETAARQGVDITMDPAPDLPLIEADRNRLTQAVLNVVLNALQAMPDGGTMTVYTGWNPQEGRDVRITIADTGEGIAPEDLPHVFDYYYTTRDSGSGLGLSVAHRIIFEHGGQIGIDSRPGGGTAVSITLPPRPPEMTGADEYTGPERQ